MPTADARNVIAAKVSDAAEAVSDPMSLPFRGSLADRSVAIGGDVVATLDG